ncbi:MAG: iron ABC transporter permease [Dehalococcoidia bacterium]
MPRRAPFPGAVAGATLLLLAVAAIALTQGSASIPIPEALRTLLGALPLVDAPADQPASWQRIVLDIRLPRVVAAGVVGASLAFSGAAYQGVFRNPLASPYLLGVASGAALGAAIAIVSPLEASAYGFGWVPLFAFLGGGLTVVAVYVIARGADGSSTNTTLILAGVALSAVLGAVTSFIMLTGGQKAQPIFSFLFGTLNTSTWERLALGAPYLVVGAGIVMAHARLLNVMQLDEDQARQLGVDVGRTRLIVLGASSLVAAATVAIAGVIGFVGLIVPHIVRLVFGGDHRQLLPLSALFGASFLIASDVISRTLIAPQEIPVGIVTALAGGPFFLYLLRARRVGDL